MKCAEKIWPVNDDKSSYRAKDVQDNDFSRETNTLSMCHIMKIILFTLQLEVL